MIQALNHVNIRVRDLGKTLRFYAEALGMPSSLPPGTTDGTREAWIHDAFGRPTLHVGMNSLLESTGRETSSHTGSGAIHHVAFDCTHYEQSVDRLRESGIAMRFNDIPTANLRQIFIVDPDDIQIELNFR